MAPKASFPGSSRASSVSAAVPPAKRAKTCQGLGQSPDAVHCAICQVHKSEQASPLVQSIAIVCVVLHMFAWSPSSCVRQELCMVPAACIHSHIPTLSYIALHAFWCMGCYLQGVVLIGVPAGDDVYMLCGPHYFVYTTCFSWLPIDEVLLKRETNQMFANNWKQAESLRTAEHLLFSHRRSTLATTSMWQSRVEPSSSTTASLRRASVRRRRSRPRGTARL